MNPEQQLASFLKRYSPEIQACARLARKRVQALLPGALELVYDNYNALVIAFASTERASDALVSLALYPRWVTLFFLHGATLSDPGGLLVGSGVQVRSIVLEGPQTLDRAEVRALIGRAQAAATTPIEPAQTRRLIIKSISPARRPRLPSKPSVARATQDRTAGRRAPSRRGTSGR